MKKIFLTAFCFFDLFILSGCGGKVSFDVTPDNENGLTSMGVSDSRVDDDTALACNVGGEDSNFRNSEIEDFGDN